MPGVFNHGYTEAPSTKPCSLCGAGEVKCLSVCVAVFWPSTQSLDMLLFHLPARLPGAWSCWEQSHSRASDTPIFLTISNANRDKWETHVFHSAQHPCNCLYIKQPVHDFQRCVAGQCSACPSQGFTLISDTLTNSCSCCPAGR